ncbi:SRPBCC family protein [Hydrogenophaga sp. 5NK40-0174]|uniref:SRPBCC family protein n=1 Tax=Hydrogenophaga sp. 5NK40-0174 TaxID=3127649 RepID=UPI0031077769
MSSTGTVNLHRVLRAPAERIYRAFLTADAVAKFLPPHGFTCRVLELDAKVGGRYRMQFTNFSQQQPVAFGGEYLELVPGERIVYNCVFDGADISDEMRTTIDLKPVICGTSVSATQTGIPSYIPQDPCYLGWQDTLLQLANLVEPDIPAG